MAYKLWPVFFAFWEKKPNRGGKKKRYTFMFSHMNIIRIYL